MASAGSQKLEDKLVCSICLELFGMPVTVSCGHNFCLECIEHYWSKQEQEDPGGEKGYTCPDCRQSFEKKPKLNKNVALLSVVDLVQSGEAQGAGTDGKGPTHAGKCRRHGRPLDLYCETEKRCICCVCTVRECRDHQRVLFEEEHERKEAELKESLEETRRKIVRTDEELRRLDEQTRNIEESSERAKSGILQKLTYLGSALENCQREAVERLEREQAAALEQVAGSSKLLRGQLDALTQHSEKAQELLACTDDRKVLEESLLLSAPGILEVPPAVEFNSAGVVDSIAPILTEVARLLLEEFPNALDPRAAETDARESTEPRAPPAKRATSPLPESGLRATLLRDCQNLTFDPHTANKYLQLSHRNRRVKHPRSADRRCPDHPERFEPWQVLCTQSFSQGHHYWEVKISDHSTIVGVAYKKIPRKKRAGCQFTIGLDDSSWGLEIREDFYSAWHRGLPRKIKEPLYKLIGVSLDYGKGVLSFYGIGTGVKDLYTFQCVFTEPLYPVFWLCEGRTITLCQSKAAA
uniref:Tripartite motif-containing protein 65 n=1 Tax=Sphenodon punctatus TaxID=8508 RepID=A0A8D0GSR0_SPHPU